MDIKATEENCLFTSNRVKTWCVNWTCKLGCLLNAKLYAGRYHHAKYKDSWCEGSRKGTCYCEFCK
ncbi:hypothetical protein PVAP13_1NG117144 [Panicum virgatum]|uniref:Uncharacterized protein n=1 Tax=Panicum virgatum TaxID=38727 RepID=A0A8T0WSU3_PANVG|nr:hypothetical protein PVAP13_1NG117144 [Panicum virgatum]